MEAGLITIFMAVFLSETVKNAAKGSANWMASNGKSLFYEDFTALNLSETATVEEITKQLEAKPEVAKTIEKKIEESPEYVKELFEKVKTETQNNPIYINTIKAKKIENVFNQPTGTFTFTKENKKK